MAEEFEYKIRVELEEDVARALSGMSRQVQNAFSSITRNAQMSTAGLRSLKQEVNDLNRVFSRSQSQTQTVSAAFSALTNNLFTLRKALRESKDAAKLLQAGLDNVQKSRRDAENAHRKEVAKGVGADKDAVKSTAQRVESLKQLERQIKQVQASYASINNNAARLQISTFVKDLNLAGQAMINFGKNLNYVGRNLTFALTIPIMGFVNYGINNLRKLDKEVVRTRKILDDAFATPEALDTFMKDLGQQLDILSFKSTDTYQSLGIARELVQGLAADFAQLGVQPEQIFTLTRLSAELEKIGDVDITVAKEFVTSAYQQAVRLQTTAITAAGGLVDTAKVSQTAINMITGSLYSLNVIENKTILSLKNIADAFPEMQGVATTFGLTMLEAASFFAPMIAAGFEVGASANSIKVSLQRIVAPTKQNKEIVEQLAKELGPNFKFKAGIGLETVQSLVDGFTMLEKSSYGTQGALEWFARLFGVRQGPRMEQAIRQLAQFQGQLQQQGEKTASTTGDIFNTIASSINKELQKVGLPAKFKADSILAIGEIARFTEKAQIEGNQAAIDAVQRGQENAVKVLQDKYGDFYKYIINESGKVLAVQALGPEQAKEIYEKELAAANNTVESKLGRARETFKDFSRQLVPVFVDIVEAILPYLQRFTNWVANLPKSSKALLGLGLAFIALSGPLTTVVATLSQIGGIVVKVLTSVGARLFKFARFPKIVGSSLAEVAGSAGFANSKLSIMGRIVNNLSASFPRLGNAIDFAFGGLSGYRNDIARLGGTFMSFDGRRSLLIRELIKSSIPDSGTRGDIDALAKDVVRLTTDSISRNSRRVTPAQSGIKGFLNKIFGIDGLDVLGDSIEKIGDIENYTTQYVREATKAFDLQTSATKRKVKETKQLEKTVSMASLKEQGIRKEIQETSDAIGKSEEKAKKSKRTRAGPSALVLPGTPYEQAVRAQFPDIDKKIKDNLTKLQVKDITEKVNKSGQLTVEQILNPVAEAVQSPIDQLVETKNKLLAELAGLQRKGPSSIEKRIEKLANVARSLGISPSRASGVLFDFAEAADAMISKPAKIIEKTSKLLPLTKDSVLEAFDKSNISVRALGREVSEGTIRAQQIVAEKLGSLGLTFQSETLKDIVHSIETGKAFDLGSIIERLEMGKKVTKRQWSDLWQGIPRGATRSKLLTADIRGDIQEAILNDKKVKKATRQITGTREDWAIRATRDLFQDFDEGTVKDFVDRIKILEEQYKSDPKMLRKIRELGRSVVLRTSGPGYQTYLTPERKALKGIELRPESILMAEKIKAEIDKKRSILEDLLARSEAEAVKKVSSWKPRTMQEMIDDLKRGITVARAGATEAETKAVSGVTRRYSQRIAKVQSEIDSLTNQLDLYANPASTIYARNMPIPKTLQELEDIASGLGKLDTGAGSTAGVLEDVIKGRDATGFRDKALQAIEVARLEREGQFSLGSIPSSDVTRSKGKNIRDLILRRRKLNMIDKGRFLMRKSGMDKVIRLFDTRLMSIGPMAGIVAAMTAMSEAPGGIISKLFGGAGAGGAMMAAGGAIDKNALQKTLLDEVLKRRGIKGDQAKKLKKTILDKFKAAGLDDWLTILNKPVNELGDSFKDVIANLKGVGEDMPGAKQSTKKLVEKLKGTGTQLKNGVRESTEKVATLIDKTLADPNYLDNIINKIPQQVQDRLEQTKRRVEEGAVPKRGKSAGPVSPIAEKRRAKKEALKKQAETAVANEIEESVTTVAEDVSEKVVVESKTKKKGNKAISEPVAAAAVVEVEKTSEKAQVAVATSIKQDLCDQTDEVKERVITGLVGLSGSVAPTQAIVAEAVADVKETATVVVTAANKAIQDKIDEWNKLWLTGAAGMSVGGPVIPTPQAGGAGGGGGGIIRYAAAGAAGGGFFKRLIDSQKEWDFATLKSSKILSSSVNAIKYPLSKFAASAGYASMTLGKLGGTVFGIIPIFGKMISQGLMNRGASAISSARSARETVLSRVDPEWGRTGQIFAKVGADIVGAGAGLYQLVNPLKMIAGLFKSIVTGIKAALALTGIGTVLMLVAAAVVAIKNSIQNFEPIITKLKEAWTYISEALTIIAKPLMDMITAFFGVKAAAEGTGDAMKDASSSSKNAVATITVFLVAVAKKFRDNADKIAKFVKDKVVPVLVQIINIIILIGKIIYDIFTKNFDSAGSAAGELFYRIGYGLLNLVKAVIPVLREFLKAATIGFAKLADFITTVIIKAVSAALSFATSKIGGWLKSAGSWIKNSLIPGPGMFTNSFWSWGGNLLKSGWNKLFGGGGDDGPQEGSGFWKRFKNAVQATAESAAVQAAIDSGGSISDALLENISFDQGWIGGMLEGLLGFEDKAFNALLGVVDKAIESIQRKFQEKFGKPIDAPIVPSLPEGTANNIQKDIDELISEVSGALEQSGEAIGDGIGGGIKNAVEEALKDLQQRFVDLIVDYLGNEISKYKSQFKDLLEEQKEKQLQYFDDQLSALEALEKAEEELTEAVEYETGRRRMIEERDLQRANYQRNRALAIYEGRVDEARSLDLEEEKNTKDFRDNLDKYDKDRAASLQQKQRETVKQILEQQKKDAEKAFDEIIKNYEKFVEDIGKYGTYNQEELTQQFEALRHEAAKATAGMQTSFREFYLEIPKIIKQYTDPTIGYFSQPLDKLIAIAKTKFGLGAESGASADSILGNTAAMMREVGQTFIDMGPNAGQSFETAFSDVVNNYVVPSVTKLSDAFSAFDPAGILKKAIDEANLTLIREQQKLIDGMNSLTKGMVDALDPALAKWVALKAAIEAAAGAASSAGGMSPGGGGGGDAGDGGSVAGSLPSNFASLYSSAFNRLFPTTYFGTGSEATRAKNIAFEQVKTKLTPMILDLINKKVTMSQLLSWIPNNNTGLNPILRKLLTDFAFITSATGSTLGLANGGRVPSLAYGGKMKSYGAGGFAVPGFQSSAFPAILHGGEFVVNAKAVQNIGMAALQGLNNMKFSQPNSIKSPQVTTINETKNVNIYVDNFIGQEQWFESMMKEYNIKIVPRNQKTAGLETRTISSYSGINRGM